eukprot:932761-Amphidinium_carterae.1
MEHVAVLQPMFQPFRRKLRLLLSQERRAQGGPSAGAPAQSTASSFVAEVPSILKRNEDYVREITQETFKFIKKQEEVLSEWSEALKSLDEDSEAHKSLLDQIAV